MTSFQSLAGSTPTDDPLTFGDLWGNGGAENAPRDIELVLMTTKHARHLPPLSFPGRELRPALFRQKRIRRVVSKTRGGLDGQARRRDSTRGQTRSARGFSPYSQAVGPADPARRTHELELSRFAERRARSTRRLSRSLERCCVSDAGLTNNFPIHFFDAPPLASISCRTRSRPRK